MRVPAHLDYVGSTGYATSLRAKGFAVGTVEHLLAALHSYNITNLLVKVQGDPHSGWFRRRVLNLIEEAGVQESEPWSEIIVDRPYRVDNRQGESISVEPADVFSVAMF